MAIFTTVISTVAAHLIFFDIRCINLTSVLPMVTCDNDAGGTVGVKVECAVCR